MRALRNGWMKTTAEKEEEERRREEESGKPYLMWGDDLKAIKSQMEKSKAMNGLPFVPAPKPKLPGVAL